ncbi:hypothetical protein chiPu_0006765 [Chiloscyllium punctatum]|uniref:Kinesin-like protein n=1 Tax=Chiloscyllium punctatum TaxID=137246 RepID=A0A401SD65_CHIPU|nr:hypothetical protein [Chiloscyllium punctatum]
MLQSWPVNPGKEQAWIEVEKIHVCVRKRPLGVREVRRGEIDVAKVEENRSVLIHEKKEAVDLKQYVQQHVFYFDEAFEETCTNNDVYLKTAYPLIQHVFSGTHYIPYGYLSNLLKAKYDMYVSRNVKCWIGVVIEFGECLRYGNIGRLKKQVGVISWGSKARSTGASGINTDSSRSHAIIQVQLKNLNDTIVGRISFVDLAGSERAADARDSDKQTKIEGAEINQSLLALKECIRALDQEHPHTPFRQSKLTLVLKDSFIGNSKTCMIANISPSHVATEHTLNTLRYADRVKELKRGTKISSTIHNGCQGARSPSPKYAGVQNTTDLFLNQMTIPDIISNPSSNNETTEQIKSLDLKGSQQQTKDLEAESNIGETLNSYHNEFQFQWKSNHKDLVDILKEKLLQSTSIQSSNISVEHNSIPAFQESINQDIINNGATGYADDNQSRDLNSQHLQAVEKVQKLIVQAHCEHLEDMLGLFEKEECLLNKLSMLDFKDYMTQLEEILMQKNKCIERMQGQIQKYLIHTGTVCNNSKTKSSVS